MRTLLIVNPHSGQERAARERRRLLDLVSRMPDIRTELTRRPGHAEELASQAASLGCGRVVAAGGDGAVNEAVNGIADSGVPLGVIPIGTGNVLAHDLRLPILDARAALEIALDGSIRAVDVGLADGRRFMLMAGFGFDADVVSSVSPRVKDVLGTAAYAPAVLKQILVCRPVTFRLVMDEGEYSARAFAAIVANCGTYASNLKLAPQASMDDGMLDVALFEDGGAGRLGFVGAAADALLLHRDAGGAASWYRAARVRVEAEPPVRMQLDGDVCGETPAEVSILPKALNLIAP